MIPNRNLQAGTKLVGRYKKQNHTCEVVDQGGRLHFKVDGKDDQVFKSPSAAGTAVTGHACDGWTFWSLAGESRLEPKAQAEPVKDKAKAEEAPAETPAIPSTHKVIRLPNQSGAGKNMTRWHCLTCHKGWQAPNSGKTPKCIMAQ